MTYKITKSGWIGHDLDGSLAHYIKKQWPEIGEPLPAGVERIERLMGLGYEVRIFTARVNDLYHFVSTIEPTAIAGCDSEEVFERFLDNDPNNDWWGREIKTDLEQRKRIGDWTEKVFGVRLRATNMKDFHCICVYDDRGVGLQENTGVLLGPDYPLREQ